jgi:hypothetical protein
MVPTKSNQAEAYSVTGSLLGGDKRLEMSHIPVRAYGKKHNSSMYPPSFSYHHYYSSSRRETDMPAYLYYVRPVSTAGSHVFLKNN